MNFQLATIILLVFLYPVGFWMAKMKEPSCTGMIAGILVLLLFLASLIYLLVSSWLVFLMMLGGGIFILMGTASFNSAKKARELSESHPYLRGRVKQAIFIGLILVGGGIYLFVLSISRSLG
jgi:hypothetical protein